ncbi:fimbrial protein [Rosenbergiella nectarea]|uniref:fimbrial protein n=1 Tax=Rosenbergiella nectarea TaxID=988801 RepID=UPI001F4D95D8|nr:fimbrial protein [Rosenbergiella nectarea]
MKRLFIALSLFFPLSFVVTAADSVITITGQVKDNMCTVSVGSQDFTVDLQTYSTKNFPSVGSTSSAIPFSIVLQNCGSAASAVKINITGTTDTVNTSLLKNSTASGYASGIGVQILNNTGSVVQLNQSNSAITAIKLTPNKTNVISYYARMVSTATVVGAGTVSSTANFTLQYN